MFSSRGTVRYEERGQGYRDVENVGKYWSRGTASCVLHHRSRCLFIFCFEIWEGFCL